MLQSGYGGIEAGHHGGFLHHLLRCAVAASTEQRATARGYPGST